jgi:enterobactin synthetase component D / holo-[acyl-carrier protein] synthase
MLDQILPKSTVVAATKCELDGQLFPEEKWIVRSAVEDRCREFVTARVCARAALARLGLPEHQAIPAGSHGDPQWPAGIVGGITHCDGYRAAAVARTKDFATIGIDAEPDKPLVDGVLDAIAVPDELRWVQERVQDTPSISWDRLLFSIKEVVYKAWFPLTARSLGFDDATVVVDPVCQVFLARLHVAGFMLGGTERLSLSGRWLARDGLIVTAIALPAA